MLCKVCCSEVRISFLQGGERQFSFLINQQAIRPHHYLLKSITHMSQLTKIDKLSPIAVGRTHPAVKGWGDLTRYPVGCTVRFIPNQKGKYTNYIWEGDVCAVVTPEECGMNVTCLVLRIDTHIDSYMMMISSDYAIVGITDADLEHSLNQMEDRRVAKRANRTEFDKKVNELKKEFGIK